MEADPTLCFKNSDCLSLCAPIYSCGSRISNIYAAEKYDIDCQNNHELACTTLPTYDRLVCHQNTCTPKQYPLNPQKIRNFVGRLSGLFKFSDPNAEATPF